MGLSDLNITVHLAGVDEAVKMAVALQEKINEAKSLAGELASLVGSLEVKVQM